MDDYVYIEILIEDQSGEVLVGEVMKKYVEGKAGIEYRTHSFKGLGKLPSNASSVSEAKSGQLLTNLPKYLKGMDSSLKNMPGQKAIFVVLDNDDNDCVERKRSLAQFVEKLGLSVSVKICLAIEEIEAWLLGDSAALLRAYPSAKQNILQKYVPDSTVGTWECLADVVYPGGYAKLKKDSSSYFEIGKFKCNCAREIGRYIDIRANISPSFRYFIRKLDQVCMIDSM